ncbi:uncharacterized protein LOC115731991 isoform X2 [Rhodamnia argentea]|uniref:Uncharacterized protein LOC115731991 isoform X2 n=1 Tax=Rhodamnia argentea TaxID=178133 RepID=A0ABM3GTI0_9MYRT|nr:uncharacterized protein LOC115731991 isoform X2 [Rhodamnia argentea]
MAQQLKSTIAMRLLVLFLAFSCLLSSLAVPSTRSLMSSSGEDDDDQVSVPDLLAQDEIMGTSEGREMVSVERRMELASNDYPGTGANNHHDPRTPGTA